MTTHFYALTLFMNAYKRWNNREEGGDEDLHYAAKRAEEALGETPKPPEEKHTPPNPEDSWAQVELFRWQYGQLPAEDDFRPLDEPAALLAMADALEVGCKTGNRDAMPSPFNVCAVMRYVARKLPPKSPS